MTDSVHDRDARPKNIDSLYDQTIPIYQKYLKNLSEMLRKAEKHADEKGIDHEQILQSRLYEGMFPFVSYVTKCCDTPKYVAQRLGGLERTIIPDDETTFEQLQARITRTLGIIARVDAATVNARTEKELLQETITMGTFLYETGQSYVSQFAIPNFHFNLTVIYSLLCQHGVPLGLIDYMGSDTFNAV